MKKNILQCLCTDISKGKKNQCFGIDAQVYQNEAHEKVENLKIYAFLKKNILSEDYSES